MADISRKQFAVLGLGRFGISILKTLSEYDVNILACDKNPARLQEVVDYATHAVQADFSDENVMKKLGLGNFDVVVLAAGGDFEASLIATMVAKEEGAPYVMVKARGNRQKKILESVGADQVVLPEFEMGAKIARSLIGSNILDVLEASDHYVIAEMNPKSDWVGKTLKEADIRRKHGVMILALRRDNKMIIPVTADEVLLADDILVILSETKINL